MKSTAVKLQIAIALLLASCSQQLTASQQDRDYLAQLEQAERLWNAADLAGYRYTLVRGGVFGYSEYEVRVGKGRCTARSRFVFEQPQLWQRAKCDGLTMPELFSDVRDQLEGGTRSVELKLDGALGYIVEFSAEPDTQLSDQDWYVRIRKFRSWSW
jgi:Family of unknown function (DUF6174)